MRISPITLRDPAGSFARLAVWLTTTVLLLAAVLWPQMASAQVVSPRCSTPFSLSVAHSGSGTVNANACHEGFGIGFLISGPTNGTVSIDTLASTVTYTHNGNSAISDTFRFDDGSGFYVQVNVTIGPASSITIAPVSLPAMTAGTAFSQTLTASGGTGPYTYAVTAGTLPTGLTLSSGGVLSGTPTQRGAFSFSVTATDATLATGTKSYTPTVAGGTLSLTPNPPPNAVITVPYSTTFTPAGGVAPMTLMWEPNPSFPLPPGLALSGNTLSGTPTATGTYTFGIRITDASTGPGSWFQVVNVTMTVSPPPTIVVNPATVPGATVGAAYSQAMSGSGGAAPYSFAISAGALPAGLALASNGALSGTPTAAGTYNFTVQATDNNGFSGTRAYSLVSAAPTISMLPAAGALPGGTVGTAYTGTWSASGGTAPYSYTISAGALPPGVIMAANGSMSGTPTASGTFNFTVTATDSSTGAGAPFSASRAYSLTIAVAPIVLSPTTIPNATVGAAYSQAITATGGLGSYTFSTAGPLPPGMTLASNGTLSGTPSASGSFGFTVTADDGVSTGEQAYTLTVAAPTITVAPASVPAAQAGVAYSQAITAGGGTAPYAFAVTAGALPAGLTLSAGGTLSGTPTSGGTFNFTVTATDSSTGSGPFSGTRAYSLTVNAAVVTLAPSSLPGGTLAAPYSEAIIADGGTAPYTYSVTAGALPPGLALSASGTLSGTPTTVGTFSFSVQAVDSSGGTGPYSATRLYTIAIADIAPIANAVSATVAFDSTSNPIALNITGGAPVSVAVGTAPTNGTAIASGTTITYTPTAGFAGSDSFSYTATNSAGTSAPATVSVTVSTPAISVSPTGPLSGAIAGAFSQTFTFSGGTAPYSASVSGLPTGVSVTGSTGDSVTVSGTPTQAGSFTLVVSGTDSSSGTGPFSVNQNIALNVSAPTLSLSPAAGTLAGTAGTAYSQDFTAAGGTAPFAYSIGAGALPPGLALGSAGQLAGTPTTPGLYTFSVVATDSSTGTGAPFSITQNYVFQVSAGLELVTASLPNATASVAYNQTLTASGGVAPYTFSLASGSLPAGLALASGGGLSGVPTATGSFTFGITVTDAASSTASRTYSIVVNPAAPIVISPSTVPDGTAGFAYAQTLTASGGTDPYLFTLSAGALPAGMTLSSAGALGGTTTVPGTYSFTVRARDAGGVNGDQAYTLVIAAPTIALTPNALPDGVAGAAYSQTLSAGGGVAPYGFSLVSGALPVGMSFSSAGVLSGTPTVAGTFNFTVRASDINGFTGDQAYSLLLTAPTIVLSPATLPAGGFGVAYSQTITASGGNGGYSYSLVTGSLPPGVAFSSAGVLAGTPALGGTYTFTVRATDAFGFSGDQAYTLTVDVPTIALAPSTLPTGIAGAVYGQTVTATGGAGPYTYAVASGALPTGLSLSSAGVLSGTSAVAGSFTFTVRATDIHGATGDQSYTLVVAAPGIGLTPATLPAGAVGLVYGQALSASGGAAPYTFSVTAGSLPAGVTLAAPGALSGTPTTAGTYTFEVTATDALGFNGTASYTLAIAEAAPVAVDDAATTDAGTALAIPVTANDTGVIDAVAVVGDPANGTAVVSGLQITYTPAAGFFGNDRFTYTAIGPGGASNVASVNVEVRALPVPVGVGQTLSTLAGQAVSFDAAAGATGSPFTGVTLLAVPAEGSVVVSGTTVTYTPAPDASGARTIGYTLNNVFGASAPITATVNVNPLPVAAALDATTLVGVAVQVQLTEGASGGPFTAADVISVSPAGAGTTQVIQGGTGDAPLFTLTFTPAAGFVGTAVVTYTLDNAFATSAPAQVTITVTQRPDPTQDAEVTGLLSAQNEATRRFARGQIDNFQSRMERLHDGGGQGFANGLTVAITSRCHDGRVQRPGEACADQPLALPGANAANAGPEAPAASQSNAAFGVWTAGGMSFGDHEQARNGNGFEFETSAISAGVDYRVSPGLVLGAGLGYGRDVSDVGENGTRSEATARSLALYSSHELSRDFFVDLLLGYQDLSFDARRYVTATGGMVEGSRDGDQWFGSLVSTYEHREQAYTLAPYLRVDVARATLDAFTEHGDPVYALHYAAQDVETTTGNLGVRMEFHHESSWGVFSPMLRAEYQYDFENPGVATLSYADLLGGPFYRSRLQGMDTSRLLLGVGAILQTEHDWLLKAEFRGLLGSGQDEHSILLNIEKEF